MFPYSTLKMAGEAMNSSMLMIVLLLLIPYGLTYLKCQFKKCKAIYRQVEKSNAATACAASEMLSTCPLHALLTHGLIEEYTDFARNWCDRVHAN